MATETWTVRRLLEWTTDYLRKKGIESPLLEAQILLAHTLGCQKIDLYVRSDEEPAEERRTAFREIIKKRSEGMPVAYLVGHREFYSLSFEVTPDVLIPRPETETLVMEALGFLKPLPAPRVLDVGTGSGCIAVSIARLCPAARVWAIDRSPAALDVARRNARKHGVEDRVTFLEGDLYGPVTGQTFDLIVSNPPYVSEAEYAALAPDVRDHEPRLALVGGTDGLDVYRRLAAESAGYLSPGGRLLLEIGATQEPAVRDLLAGPLAVGRTLRDLAGRPRVVEAKPIS